MMRFEEILSNLTRYPCPAECFNEVTMAFGFKIVDGEPAHGYYSKSFTIYGRRTPNTYELRRKYMCE